MKEKELYKADYKQAGCLLYTSWRWKNTDFSIIFVLTPSP